LDCVGFARRMQIFTGNQARRPKSAFRGISGHARSKTIAGVINSSCPRRFAQLRSTVSAPLSLITHSNLTQTGMSILRSKWSIFISVVAALLLLSTFAFLGFRAHTSFPRSTESVGGMQKTKNLENGAPTKPVPRISTIQTNERYFIQYSRSHS
jgi:hypothetical protein